MAQRGFTLLELLVVIAIAALLFGLAAPRLTLALPGVELRGDALQLASGLRAARGEAIYRNREVSVLLDADSRQVVVPALSRRTTLSEGIEARYAAPRQEGDGAARAVIRFFPDGSSTGGAIALRAGERLYRIDIHWLTGRVRISG